MRNRPSILSCKTVIIFAWNKSIIWFYFLCNQPVKQHSKSFNECTRISQRRYPFLFFVWNGLWLNKKNIKRSSLIQKKHVGKICNQYCHKYICFVLLSTSVKLVRSFTDNSDGFLTNSFPFFQLHNHFLMCMALHQDVFLHFRISAFSLNLPQ